MNLGVSPLLVERPSLREAVRTMAGARSAAGRGDLRLGVSRAMTAIIQAGIAGYLAEGEREKLSADRVIQDARELVMGIVVQRALRRSG